MFGKMKNFVKKLIKKVLRLFGYRIKRVSANGVSSCNAGAAPVARNTAVAPRAAVNNTARQNTAPQRVPFSEQIYMPRWRLKNYYALKEFGEGVKRWFIEQKYTYFLGSFPDLDNPKDFNEKIHWLNLNYQDERITRCCDKYEMKNYVSEVVGKEYVVPVIKVYEKAADINLDELPDKFAIKVNWGDGAEFSEVINDKSKASLKDIKLKMNNALQPWNNLYYSHFFWGYKNVPGKIFVEKFIDHEGTDLTDYKFHCFNGVPKFVLVCENRSHKRMNKTFLDIDWKILPCRRSDGDINSNVKKPENYDEMLKIIKKLAEPFPFVRVDLYTSAGRIYVGEMTFHPGCGLESFIPKEWNRIVGDMLELPEPRFIDAEE